MKKTLNTQAISSELSQSRFFRRSEPPQKPEATTKHEVPQQKPAPDTPAKSAVSQTPPAKRKTTLDYKISVWISKQQFERLEDLKTEIRRKYDLPFSKQQAFLCAIAEVIAEYEAHGEQSSLIRYLKSLKES